MKTLRQTTVLCIVGLSACIASVEAGEVTVPVVCMPRPLACTRLATDAARYDAAFQRELVEQVLKVQPGHWQTILLYVPNVDDGALRELQIRYLEELLAKERAKNEAK